MNLKFEKTGKSSNSTLISPRNLRKHTKHRVFSLPRNRKCRSHANSELVQFSSKMSRVQKRRILKNYIFQMEQQFTRSTSKQKSHRNTKSTHSQLKKNRCLSENKVIQQDIFQDKSSEHYQNNQPQAYQDPSTQPNHAQFSLKDIPHMTFWNPEVKSLLSKIKLKLLQNRQTRYGGVVSAEILNNKLPSIINNSRL